MYRKIVKLINRRKSQELKIKFGSSSGSNSSYSVLVYHSPYSHPFLAGEILFLSVPEGLVVIGQVMVILVIIRQINVSTFQTAKI
jgi:hypothetical protein